MTTKVSLNNDNYLVSSNAGSINIATTFNINTTGTLTLDSEDLIYLEAISSIHLRPSAAGTLYLGNVDYTTGAVNTRASGDIIASTTGGNLSLSCSAGTMTFADSTSGGSVTLASLISGGSALTVQDEGIEVDDAVTTLNFTGSGVVVTESPAHQINVAIAGGGGSGYWDTIGTNSLYATSAFHSVSGDGNLVGGVANSTTGNYNVMAGSGNDAGAGTYNTCFGADITLFNSDGNSLIGRDFNLSVTDNTIFGGRYHVTDTVIGSNIFGNGHSVSNSDYNSVFGNTNTLQYANHNLVGGYDSDITGTSSSDAEYNICFGNEIDILTVGTEPVNHNVLFGYQNQIDRSTYNMMHGSGNSIVFGINNLVFGVNHSLDGDNPTVKIKYNLVIGSSSDMDGNATEPTEYNIVGGENHDIDNSKYNILNGEDHILDTSFDNIINGTSITIDSADISSLVRYNYINGSSIILNTTTGNSTAYSIAIGSNHTITDSDNNIVNGVYADVDNCTNNIITGGFNAVDYHDLDYVVRSIIGGSSNTVTGTSSDNVSNCFIFGADNTISTTGARNPSMNLIFGYHNESVNDQYSLIFGYDNESIGSRNVIFGANNYINSISGYCLVTGENNNVINDTHNFTSGYQAANWWYATHVNSGGQIITNDEAQIISHAPLMATTTNTTWTTMFMDPSGSESFVFRGDASYVYTIYIIAKQRGATAAKSFKFEGMAYYDGAGHTITGGVKNIIGSTALTTNWDAGINMTPGNSTLVMRVKGDTGQNVNWSAAIDLVEIQAN